MVLCRQVLLVKDCKRRAFVRRVLIRTEAADAWRKRFGKAHPEWGNGTLESACSQAKANVVNPGGTPEAEALLLIFAELTRWRMEKT